jgi:hypothetical protein
MSRLSRIVGKLFNPSAGDDRPRVLPARPRVGVMALEPRVMFDGAMAATAVAEHHAVEAAAKPVAPDHHGEPVAPHLFDAALPPVAAHTSQHEVVFVDSTLPDWQSLVEHAPAGAQVVMLDPTRDGVDQIAQALRGRSDVSAVHIVSHGGEGYLVLGNTMLSSYNLDHYGADMATIRAALAPGADIHLYGCDVAFGSDGSAFVQQLAHATGADVAASSNDTGVHGDWVLEVSTGLVQTRSMSDTAYGYDLATLEVTNLNDSGAGSLRQAIADATGNDQADTIVFDPALFASGAQTLTLTSGALDVAGTGDNDAFTIIGPGSSLLTISGNNSSQIFAAVKTSSTADASPLSIAGMTLTQGKFVYAAGTGYGGGAIASQYSGGLTLDHVVIKNNQATGEFWAGGGVYFLDPSHDISISNSSFQSNSTPDANSYGGGARINAANVSISNSTFSGNTSARNGGAAVINASGSLSISNSTFFNNTAGSISSSGRGGALDIEDGTGTLRIANSTIVGNHVLSAASTTSGGGGLFVRNNTIELYNNLIGNNTSSTNGTDILVYQSGIVSGSNNIVGTAVDTLPGLPNHGTNNLTGTITTLPTMGALAYNGGAVKTIAIDAGGSAANAGIAAQAPATDARGYGRGSTVDIGAYEVNDNDAFGFSGSFFPPNGYSNVPNAGDLSLDFGQAVTAVAGKNIVIHNSDGSVFETIAATDARISIVAGVAGAGSKVVINPTGTFASNAGYYVTIDAGAFVDAGGNSFSGISAATTWAFTAAVAPSTIASAVYDASTGTLMVTGTDMASGDTIVTGKLTLVGQGGASYTLTSANVSASSGTSFTITLNAADKVAVNGLLNRNGSVAVDGTTFNLSAAAGWDATTGAVADTSGNGVTVSNVAPPTITSATYDASTHVLTVTGSGLVGTIGANNDISVSRLTLTGEGGVSYTLTSSDVEVNGATSFSVTLNAADRAQVERMFNKEGTSSTGGTTYNLAAADDWDSVIGGFDIADASNAVTVSNVPTPAITSASYDASTGDLVVTGSGFLSLDGVGNDVVASKFTFTGEGGQSYTLTDTADVDIVSGTSFTLHLSPADRAAINQIVNKNGTSSTGGTTYNLSAAEDWAAGADPTTTVADITGNGITASNVAVPAITSATYDASTGTVVVTGTGFLTLTGAGNDVIASKFTFTGEGGQTWTLTDTADVDIVSGTSFTLVLSAADKAAVDRIIDANGSVSAGGTTYNVAAAEDWAAGADPVVNTKDLGASLTASNVEATPVLSTSGGTTAFVEGTPIAVDGGLTVTDADNITLAGATVTLSGGFRSGEDILLFVNDGSSMGNITGSYDGGTGVLTLTSAGGTATVAQWQAALRSVTYQDISDSPDTTTRTISFTVNDGTRDSLAGTKAVSVTAVNDAPTLSTTANPTPTFTEGGGAVTLFTGTSITTVEAGQSIHALTLTVGGLADGAAEILTIDGTAVALIDANSVTTAANGYTVSVALSGGVATVTITKAGDYSASAAQTLVDGLTYRNTSDDPTVAGGRSITLASIQDSGGTASGGVDTTAIGVDATVTLTAVNDAPVVSTSGGSTSFVAGDNVASTPVAIDGGLTVWDLDNASLASATVSISGGFHAGEDVLGFTNDGATMGNITASYNAATGVMTLTSAGGTATLAQWQAALRSVTYTNLEVTPDATTRTVSFSVDDGTDASAFATRTVTVTAVDQTPIVTTTGGTTDYIGGTTAVTIDGGIVVTDLDNTTQSQGTVSISSGFHAGDTLAFLNTNSTVFGNIVGSYNAATGVLTLTSLGATATNAQWAHALSAVTFSAGSSAVPGNRTIDFALSDGTKTSAVATDTVDVLGPPQITTDAGSASFVAGDNTASTPVVIDAGLTVTDGSSSTLASATIAITGNFRAGEDVLSFTNDGSTMGNITATYNDTTGVLTLTSAGATATLAQWQAALDSVTYTDTEVTPDTATRTVSFTVIDGGGTTSNTATRTITVTAVDQTPIVTTNGGTTDYVGGTTAVTIDGGITVSDLDNATQSSATVAIGAGFHSGDVLGFSNTSAATFGNIVASYNAATGVLTLTSSGATATDAQWSNALSAVTFSSNSTSYGSRTIEFATNDGSKSSAVAIDTVNLLGLPKVTDVSSTTPDGSYKVGDTIYLTVTFDQAVVVDGTGGTPTLQMETGGVDRDAVYVSGSGSTTLTFAYTVQDGDSSADLDYTSTAALALDGGTIRSSAGVDAELTLPATGGADSVAGQHDIVVDGIAPTVVSVDAPANGTYVAGQSLDFTVNYSEAVTVDTSAGTPRIAIALDTGGIAYADYVSGSGSTALVFRYTVAAGQNDATGIALDGAIDTHGGAIHDAVGNAGIDALNGVASTSAVRVDAVPPTASITLSDTALKVGDTSTVTISFSEAVSGLTLADLTVDHGSLSGLASSDGGLTWTATFTPDADVTDASNLIVLDNTGYIDAAGNTGTGTTSSANYAIDTVRPSASIALSDTALKAGETSTVTISFSEAVSGLTAADFTVDHGSLSGLASSDGGLTWTATFTPSADVTDASNQIVLDNGGYTDAAGNTGTGTTASANYAIDSARPTASIALSDTALKIGETSTVTIRFSEAVSGLTLADFTVDHGSLSGLASSDGGLTWTATFTPSADVSASANLIRLAMAGVTDAAGNTGQAVAASAPYAVDTHAPQVVAIDRADASPNSGQGGVDYTVSFDEDVSGLDAADFTLATTGNVHAVIDGVTRVDGHTYTVHLSDVGGTGNLQIGLAAGGSGIADLAGNALATGAQGQPYVIGGVSPTVLPPVTPAPIAPAAAHEPSVVLLSPLSMADLPTLYYRDAAAPRSLELPFDPGGGVLDALAGLATVPQDRSHAVPTIAWPERLPIAPDRAFNLVLPAVDGFEVLQVHAADGRPLPSWLAFDPVTGTLAGTPPHGYSGTLVLLLTVRDGQGHFHEVPLELSATRTTEVARDSRPATSAKPALAAQFGAQRQAGGDHAALLRQLAVAQRHAATAQVRP